MAKSKKRKSKKRNSRETAVMRAPRNPLALNPLMRRGGAHQQSNSAQRAAARREVKQMARDSGYFILSH
ncbi:hypothetical protein FLL45_06165 [Aliikangiella marina]|uniref:Uncharacterized protein n=1 Tax=Aliikangiella marina TaxID=1712262 RepID=A0A545TJY0_9GAMM|nr:hypothetical protein [Aliikangiella marina]TQV77525.1 hypothetical protein FLL45_06165 [Aliikangiella marina]